MTNYDEKIKALIESGAFDVEFGKVEINIANGQIQNIYIQERKYFRLK